MKIQEVQVRNHKSINEWQTIDWSSGLMTFVGKNGSGKTSILEVLDLIFGANSDTYFYSQERQSFEYKIIIKLSRNELAGIDPELEYTSENYLIEATYEGEEGNRLKVNKIRSRALVSSIRSTTAICME